MCIDYTGVNKCCPKDPFALPRIDQVVDSTADSQLLCFLDAYSGYHQIKMRESDQLKTSFTTPYGTFCYITMPFGLKNAGATYQRCMQKLSARTDPPQCSRLRRRHCGVVEKEGGSPRGFVRNFSESPKIPDETQCRQMCFRRSSRQTIWIYRLRTRDRS